MAPLPVERDPAHTPARSTTDRWLQHVVNAIEGLRDDLRTVLVALAPEEGSQGDGTVRQLREPSPVEPVPPYEAPPAPEPVEEPEPAPEPKKAPTRSRKAAS